MTSPSSIGEAPKKYDAEYVGTIVQVDSHPKGGLMVKARVHPLFDNVQVADIPWATYKLPFGCRPGAGVFFPVQVGDKVWCDFPFDYDTRRPRITGSVHEIPEDFKPNMPPEAFAGQGQADIKRADGEPEPEKPEYHRDVVFSQHGVVVQITKDGAFRIVHTASGSNFEVDKEGQLIAHTEKKLFIYAKDGAQIIMDDKAVAKIPETLLVGDLVLYGDFRMEGPGEDGAGGGIGTLNKRANVNHVAGSYTANVPFTHTAPVTMTTLHVDQLTYGAMSQG